LFVKIGEKVVSKEINNKREIIFFFFKIDCIFKLYNI